MPSPRILFRDVFLVACFILFAAPFGRAQVQSYDPTLETGMKPYGSFEGGNIDSISTNNGNLNLHIPLVSYPQRGGKLQLNFFLTLHNASYQVIPSTIPGCSQAPYACGYGTNVYNAAVQITNNLNLVAYASGIMPPPGGLYASVTTPDGARHEMGATSTGWRTNDASGFLCLNNCATLIERNGIRYTQFSSASQATKIEDPNGNFISASTTSGGAVTSYTDTLARTLPVPPSSGNASGYNYTSDTSGCTGTLPTVSAFLWNLPGYQGGQMTYKICYANVYYGAQTCTKQQSTITCGVTLSHSVLIQSIVLPNNTTWTFTYASADPNVQGSSASGNLLQVTFPTGGYIKYGFTGIYRCQTPTSSTVTTYTYALATRTINSNDGTGEHAWTYSFGSSNGGVTLTTSSVDPLGQKTVHTVSPEGGTCAWYETQTQTYDASGNLVKTVNTDYFADPDYLSTASPATTASNVVPIRVTTTWPNGQVSKVETDYDSGVAITGSSNVILYGLPVAKREYDYGSGSPGSLIRTTTTTYQSLNNSSYLNNNLLTLPSSVAITGSDGTGTSTTYSYDQFSLAASGVSTQHDSASPDGSYPGNTTTVQRARMSTTTTTYYDTGTIYQVTDPNGNTTTSAYSSTFLGAYPTTVTNALNQSTAHSYDFNTGVLISTKDPNNQTTTFGYDGMARLSQITYPDGGSASITRQESSFPFTTTLTKLIDSTPKNLITTDVFDGFGRVTESQLNSDQQGVVYTDTTYDALGRAATVSNPYRKGTDITTSSGTTTYAYDALGRKTTITYPDGSLLTTAYCGASTLVTDPTNRWRRSRADGLGRLVEVDEPNAVGAAVNPNGCPGTGEPIWVTTYGYDALGNLTSVLQNGSHSRSFSYDELSRLLTANNPESGTTYYSYDAVGNLISKHDTRDIQTDYGYDALNRLVAKTFSDQSPPVAFFYDGQTPPASTPSSAIGIVTMAGSERSKLINPCAPLHRSCVTTIYDGGTITLTVNGVNFQITYNNGSSPSTLATAMASAINSNTSSPVTATASNAIVSLVAKSTGPASDYPMSSTAASSDPTYFPGASFVAAPFGFSLVGGCNAVGSFTMANGIGRRTGACDAAGGEAWAYDPMGRPTSDLRNINGFSKTTSYQYALDGSLSKLTYPTGRVVNYASDAADRPSTAIDGSNGVTYASGFQTSPGSTCIANVTCYTPQGTFYALSIGQSSSFTGLNLTHIYNNRLQPQEFKASSSGGNAIDITYSFADPGNNNKNAGHVFSITNNLDGTRSQSFAYDQLNRLTSAWTTSTYSTSPAHCWNETFNVDPWGNLQSIAASSNSAYTGCYLESGFSTTADGNNHLPSWAYDASGNATSDGAYSYAWDGESQLKSATLNGTTTNYLYDGDGRRAAKLNNATPPAPYKLYWYGSGGDILAETDASGNTTAEYIFFGGKRIAMIPSSGSPPVAGNPTYYVEDLLGTSRVLTTNTGVVCYDADFYPYGGERSYTNTCPQNYKFEGKERDTETGNDDFGARYYSNRFGRWLSADWSAVPVPVPYANLSNPQTLNLYTMVSDDPESFADLDGHADYTSASTPCNVATGSTTCQQQQEDQTQGGQAAANTAAQAAQPQNQSQDQAQQQSQTQQQAAVAAPFPLLSSGEAAGSGVLGTILGTLAAGAAVVVAADVAITRITDTLVQNERDKQALIAIESVVAAENARALAILSEHTKGKRESTRTKHEEGEARKRLDRGGEKADPKRLRPRIRPKGHKGPWPPRPPAQPKWYDNVT